MIKLRIFASVLLTTLLFAMGCDKPDNTPDPYVSPFTGDTIDVNDTFQAYWNFPVGSWWVYKRTDTTANIYDTAVVIQNIKEVQCRTAPDCYYHRGLHIQHSTWAMYWQDGIENVDTTEKPLMILSSQFPDVLNFYGDLKFSMQLKWPYEFNETPYGVLSDTLDWLLTNGETVKSVNMSKDKINAFLRFGQDVGLVNFQYSNETTWKLIDYKINK